MRKTITGGAAVFMVCVLAAWLPVAAQDGSGHWIRRDFPARTTIGATPGLFVQISQSGRIPDKHEIVASVTGEPDECKFNMEGSAYANGSPWIDLSGEQDCGDDMAVGVINRFFPYVRVNLTSLSGGTTPSVLFTYIGVAQ
jgi:hypothetical protein